MRALTLLVVMLVAVPAMAQRSRVRRPATQTPAPKTEVAPSPEPVQLRYPKLIEIDPMQVKGQYNQAGGVYLYERKSLPNKSMVHERESFREELVGEL